MYASTIQVVLTETLAVSTARRTLSEISDAKTAIRASLGDLQIWQLYLHKQRHSPTETQWTITVVLPRSEIFAFRRAIADPVYIPQLNHAWADHERSIF